MKQHEEEELELSLGLRRIQMYAEHFMGGLAGVILLLYLDRKYAGVLPPSMASLADITTFISFLICTLFAGAKALYRITSALKELRSLIGDITKYKNNNEP